MNALTEINNDKKAFYLSDKEVERTKNLIVYKSNK